MKRYSRDGVIRPAGRGNLEIERRKLGLSREEADTIEADELRPYQEYAKHKTEYEDYFREELEFAGGELDDRSREELNDLIRQRSLKPDDVKAIEQRVMQELNTSDSVVIGPLIAKKFPNRPSPMDSTSPNLSSESSDLDLIAIWQAIIANIDEAPSRAILSTNCQLIAIYGSDIKIGVMQRNMLEVVKKRSSQLGKACTKTLKRSVKLSIVAMPEKPLEGSAHSNPG